MSTAVDILNRADPVLWILTAADGPRRGGLVATFVTPASIVADLPRVVIGLAKLHFTWELVEASHAFVLHQFGEDRLDWVERFGLRSGRNVDKLADLPHRNSAWGPILTEADAWLGCQVEATLDTGDRIISLAAVVDAASERDRPPLTLQRFLQLASAEVKREMKCQYEADAVNDGAMIAGWRAR